MSKAEDYIEQQTLLPEQIAADEEVVIIKDAIKAVEMAREEIRKKAILLSKSVDEFIESASADASMFVEEQVLTTIDANFAVESAEQELKEKAIECFRHFVEDYCRESGHWDIYKGADHYIKVFTEMINK